MRILIFFSILSTLLYSNTDQKIIEKQKDIKYQKIEKSKMNKKLDSFISSVNNQKSILNKIDIKISSLNKDINLLSKELSLKQNNISSLEKEQKDLLLKKDNVQKNLLDYFSHNYYLSQSKVISIDDLINEEVVKTISDMTTKKISKITKDYIDLTEENSKLSKKIINLKSKKSSLENKRKEVLVLKKDHEKELLLLNAKVKNYKKILQNIISKEEKFQKELSKLKFIKQEEIKKERELAKQRELELRAKENKISKIDNSKVKKYGSSYVKTKTRRYRGAKTISPIINGVITKSFGTYIDPIYKIKVYNDSITLKAPKNSLVKSIFSGRIVFVGKSSNESMVVVKHNNGLYSIYANLIKISPYIKKGYKIQKGDVIARIEDELIFEVTYKDIPINPLEVIKL